MQQAMRNMVRKSLGKLARVLPCEDYLNKLAFGCHLSKLFQLHDIQCVIDVGAHRGGFARFLRNEVGYSGKLISLEPASGNLLHLRPVAAKDPQWEVYPLALGSVEARQTMHVMKQSVFNSFLEPDRSRMAEFHARNTVDHEETVEVRRLDHLWVELERTHQIKNVFLKIDTQGYDMEVLRGAGEALDQIRAIQTEASVQPLYEKMTPYPVILDFLVERGFQIAGMFPVVRDSELRLVEFDLVMTRPRAEVHSDTQAR